MRVKRSSEIVVEDVDGVVLGKSRRFAYCGPG
jgi:hypothetical protein